MYYIINRASLFRWSMDLKSLRESFVYHEDGFLERVDYNSGKHRTSKNNKGYRQICYKNKLYLEHRLIFMYHHGYLPKEIDHIDRCKDNNRIENLREVTHKENLQNVDWKAGVTGVKNISPHRNKFRVVVNRKYLGVYKTVEEAECCLKDFYCSLIES